MVSILADELSDCAIAVVVTLESVFLLPPPKQEPIRPITTSTIMVTRQPPGPCFFLHCGHIFAP